MALVTSTGLVWGEVVRPDLIPDNAINGTPLAEASVAAVAEGAFSTVIGGGGLALSGMDEDAPAKKEKLGDARLWVRVLVTF